MAGGSDESKTIELPPDHILMEALSWLPAKSLMQFKCVSKHWFSLITDPHFAEVHQTRSYIREGGVVLVEAPENYGRPSHGWDRRFLVINWAKKDPMNRSSIYEPSVPYTANRITNIVDGLICFYHRHDPEVCIIVYNFTTRENLPLPLPVPPTNDTNRPIERKCYLSFDTINKVYKVFLITFIWWPGGSRDDQCQVFTLGHNDNRWRSISTPPGISCPWDDSFCELDGFLYWKSHDEKVIVTLSVEQELFDFIQCPQEPAYNTHITQLRGHLTVVEIHRHRKASYEKITLWRLIDRTDIHCPVWTKEVIAFPFPYDSGWVACTSFGLVSLVSGSKMPYQVIIKCYMLATAKYKELKVNNAQGILRPGYEFCPSKLVENIMPLKKIGGVEETC